VQSTRLGDPFEQLTAL